MDISRRLGSWFKGALRTAFVCLVLFSVISANDEVSTATFDPTSTVPGDQVSTGTPSESTDSYTSPDTTLSESSTMVTPDTTMDENSTVDYDNTSSASPTMVTPDTTMDENSTVDYDNTSSASPGTEESGTSVTEDTDTSPTDNPGSSPTDSAVTAHTQPTVLTSSVSDVTSSSVSDGSMSTSPNSYTDASTSADVTTEDISQSHTPNKVAIGVGTTFGIIGAVLIVMGITYGVTRRKNPHSGVYSNLNEPSVRFENPTYGVPNTNEGYSYD